MTNLASFPVRAKIDTSMVCFGDYPGRKCLRVKLLKPRREPVVYKGGDSGLEGKTYL